MFTVYTNPSALECWKDIDGLIACWNVGNAENARRQWTDSQKPDYDNIFTANFNSNIPCQPRSLPSKESSGRTCCRDFT